LLLLALAASAGPAAAQSRTPEPGEELTVYLMTMGVGAESWERYGHNAIMIWDRARGTRVSYNYGMFSFRQENFLLRFIQGRMRYWVDSMDTDWDVRRYRAARRSVWIQELNLTPSQRAGLRDFLQWNVRGENRYYRYDYYRDNCSTRVRDALDRIVGGAIKLQSNSVASGVTYRFHTQRLNADNLALYTGLLLAVGPQGDRPLTAWEEMFLPLALRQRIRAIRIPGADGRPVPLVRSEQTVYLSDAFPVPDRPPDWIPGFLTAGLALGCLLAVTGAWAGGAAPAALAMGEKRIVALRVCFLLTAGLWCLAAGVTGVILSGLWAFTDHTIAVGNQNVAQLSPFALALLPLLGATFRPESRIGLVARGLTLVVVGLALFGLALKLLPGLVQGNGEILAFGVPANLGLGAGVWGAGRGSRGEG
jgi:hypothetical protein